MSNSIARRITAFLALCSAILATFVVTPLPAKAAAEDTVATPWMELQGARLRLIAGPAGSGKSGYLAGVEVVLADGWKTYWRMPGDAGVPPSFDWSDSANTSAINVLYPAPMRLIEPAAQTIGYKGAVTFPVEVKPLDPAKPVELSLKLELGICREICIPAEATLMLRIPASGLSGVSPVASWRQRVPKLGAARGAGDPELKRVVANLDDAAAAKIVVEASFPGGGSAADVFIEAPDGLYVPMAKRLPDGPGGIVRFESNLSRIDAKDFKGKTLTLTLVGEGGATEATWKLP